MTKVRTAALSLLVGIAGLACEEEKPSGPPPARFQAVEAQTTAVTAATVSFCEKIYKPGERHWASPPERPVPGTSAARDRAVGWTWVNLWASWCGPCVKEFPLLKRWGETLRRDGVALEFELWSVDDEEAALVKAIKERSPTFPGPVRWLKSFDELPALLAAIGVEKDSAIPIHLLVDSKGDLRCVRVGSVAEDSYGTVKSILQGT
ncbi:MAG: TlpA family protein disulfide reductase [Deltaproteobacteria bacterium]|nr:TlpA family protein disulfide reductase [Deltaproteobacteria bacterium]